VTLWLADEFDLRTQHVLEEILADAKNWPGVVTVLADLAAVTVIDSTSLAVVTRAFYSFAADGIAFRMAHASRTVDRLQAALKYP
jgi:anti-anti-sigma factor